MDYNKIQVGRYSELIRRLLLPTGPGAHVIAPEILPVLVLESDRPEWSWLKGEVLAAGRGFRAAGGAATRAQVQLFNPADSNVFLIVEGLFLPSSTSLVYNVGITDSALADNDGTKNTRDTRQATVFGATGSVVGQIRSGAPAVPLNFNELLQLAVLANTTLPLEMTVILLPGRGLSVNPGADDTAVRANFVWKERPFLESER